VVFEQLSDDSSYSNGLSCHCFCSNKYNAILLHVLSHGKFRYENELITSLYDVHVSQLIWLSELSIAGVFLLVFAS
jgi:hypothetical protein